VESCGARRQATGAVATGSGPRRVRFASVRLPHRRSPAAASPRCTNARRGEIRPRWSSSPCAEACPELVRTSGGGGPILPANVNHPETEPMIIGPPLPREDQRNTATPRSLLHRGGGREDDVGDTDMAPTPSWIFRRARTSTRPRVDFAELAVPIGTCADLQRSRRSREGEDYLGRLSADTLIEQASRG